MSPGRVRWVVTQVGIHLADDFVAALRSPREACAVGVARPGLEFAPDEVDPFVRSRRSAHVTRPVRGPVGDRADVQARDASRSCPNPHVAREERVPSTEASR